MEETSDVWRLAAISSFSVLAVVLLGAVLLVGLTLHRRRAQKRPLRGETRGQRSLWLRSSGGSGGAEEVRSNSVSCVPRAH